MLPTVTIITPTHNRAALLKHCMHSVLSQGYTKLQYIIVDDASTDATPSLVQEFQQQYPNTITYLRNDPNLGESGAINRGWQAATGTYVATLSDDDMLLPNWFDVCVGFMEAHPEVLVGYPDWHIISHDGETIGTTIMPDYTFLNLFATCASAPGPGVMICREPLAHLRDIRNTKYTYMPDYLMWITIATLGNFARIPHITACWRSHATSITVSANTSMKAIEMERMITEFLEHHQHAAPIEKHAAKLRTKNRFQIGYMLFKAKKYRMALSYGLKALRISPYWSCVIAWCYIKRVVKSCK